MNRLFFAAPDQPSWPGFVPAIHVFLMASAKQDVDARDKPGVTICGPACPP
jgi:hypothetical protein